MKNLIFKIRLWTAYRLYRLATWIEPEGVRGFAASIRDQFIYGNGFTRINPKDVYKDGGSLTIEKMEELYEKAKKYA